MNQKQTFQLVVEHIGGFFTNSLPDDEKLNKFVSAFANGLQLGPATPEHKYKDNVTDVRGQLSTRYSVADNSVQKRHLDMAGVLSVRTAQVFARFYCQMQAKIIFPIRNDSDIDNVISRIQSWREATQTKGLPGPMTAPIHFLECHLKSRLSEGDGAWPTVFSARNERGVSLLSVSVFDECKLLWVGLPGLGWYRGPDSLLTKARPLTWSNRDIESFLPLAGIPSEIGLPDTWLSEKSLQNAAMQMLVCDDFRG